MTRYADLDAGTRNLVDQALGTKKTTTKQRKRARPSAGGVGSAVDDGSTFVCECGERFATYAAAERHPAGPGHTRLETQMSGTMSATGGSTSHS